MIKNRIFFNFFAETDFKTVFVLLTIPVLTSTSWYIQDFAENLQFIPFRVNRFYTIIFLDIVLYLIIPVLINKLIFRQSLKSSGINFNSFRKYRYILLLLFLFIPVSWIISANYSASYLDYYIHSKYNSVPVAFYFIIMFFYVFSWEYFWRGFVLFNLEKKLGVYAIFIQTIPFVMMHFGKPWYETYSSILGGILLGYLALKTRSFIYGFILHYLLIAIIEIFILYRFFYDNQYVNFRLF